MTILISLLRFLACVLMLIWLGCIITLTFYVAPTFFDKEAHVTTATGVLATKSIAGDLMSPLLHKMDWTNYLIPPSVIFVLIAIGARTGKRNLKTIIIASSLLLVAWCSGIYGGVSVSGQIQTIRAELRQKYGAFDQAPETDPQRKQFSKLHGVSMMLVMLNLAMGLGAFYVVTQRLNSDITSSSLIDPGPTES